MFKPPTAGWHRCIKSQTSTNPQLLTVDGGDVVGQVGAGRSSASLHEQLPVGAAMAGHQVVVFGRAGPRRRRGKPEEPAFFQMLVSHWEGEETQRGERLRVGVSV